MKIPYELHNDPLYKAVLEAKTKEEFSKNLNTLRQIRGILAVKKLINLYSQK